MVRVVPLLSSRPVSRPPSLPVTVLACASVVLASSAVLALPRAASADTATCQGKEATILGPNNGQNTEGTPGDDVIVTTADGHDGTGWIRAGAGNDVLCIVPGDGRIPHPRVDSTFTVQMGEGNDTVVVQEERNVSYLRVELGDGDDTFLGSSRPEHVWTGNIALEYPELGGDFGKDYIDAGLGVDTINSGSPSPDVRNDDTIISGPGGDSLIIGGFGAVLDNGGTAGDGEGDGLAIVHKQWLKNRVTVDNTARVAASEAGELMRWTNVQAFHIFVDSPVTFTGSDSADYLSVSTSLEPEYRYATTFDAAMGAGDDNVRYATGPMSGTIDGGAGEDSLEQPDCENIRYVLGEQFRCIETTYNGGRAHFVTMANGFEGKAIVLASRRAEVIGTRTPDVVVVNALRARVDARAGNDRVTFSPYGKGMAVFSGGAGDDVLIGGNGGDRLDGGAGRDKLRGMNRSDVLRGGAGRDSLVGGKAKDTARGGPGRDRCSTEVSTGCERSRT